MIVHTVSSSLTNLGNQPISILGRIRLGLQVD